MSTKLLISGSREGFTFTEFERTLLKRFPNPKEEISEIVAGGANGVDSFAKEFAIFYDIPYKEFLADWDRHGKKAGYLRNIEMGDFVKYHEGVLMAFCFNFSKGTTHMIKYAKQIDLPAFVVHKPKNNVAMFN